MRSPGRRSRSSTRTSRACRCRVRRSAWVRSQGIYTIDLSNGGALEFTGEFYHEDKNLFYISARGTASTTAYLDEKNLLNAAVTYNGADDKWFVRALRQEPDRRALSHRVAGRSPICGRIRSGAPRSTSACEVGMHFGQ